jgi:hypothetical protein
MAGGELVVVENALRFRGVLLGAIERLAEGLLEDVLLFFSRSKVAAKRSSARPCAFDLPRGLFQRTQLLLVLRGWCEAPHPVWRSTLSVDSQSGQMHEEDVVAHPSIILPGAR